MDRGIDWMYQGQATGDPDAKPSALELEDAEKKAEDFLLGKEYTSEGAPAKGDFNDGANEGVNAVVKLEVRGAAAAAAVKPAGDSAYGPGGNAEATVADKNEAFRQRVEDPMFMVSRKEREKKSEAQKQQALYERVVGPVAESDDELSDHGKKKASKHERKQERRERRRREKEAKKLKKRHRHHDRSDDDEDERYERKRHRRREDYSEDDSDRDRRHYSSSSRRRKESSRYDSDSDRDRDSHRRDRRKRSRSPHEDDDRKHQSRHGGGSSKRHHGSSRNHRSRSRSPDESRHRHRHHDRTEGRDHQRRSFDEDRSYRREDNRDNLHGQGGRQNVPAKKAGFGLQGNATSTSNNNAYSPKDLGPQKDLVRQKREAAEDERRRARERASSRRTMTAEERAEALNEMQATAQARTRDIPARSRDDEDDEAPRQSKAGFIKDLNEQAHGLKGAGSQSLSSRMAQNRNTQQKLHDDSFL